WIDVVELCSPHERQHDRGPLATSVRPGKEPGLPSQSNSAQLPLGRIVTEADATITEKACECVDPLQHVVHGFCQIVVPGELTTPSSHPADEIVDQGGNRLATYGDTLLRGRPVDRTLEPEDRIHALHRLEGAR